MSDYNNFFERATALRDAIKKGDDCLKDVKLDILGQIVNRVFIYEKIPYNIYIQSGCVNAANLTLDILKELQIEATITLDKTYTPVYPITEVNAFVSEVSK